MHTRTLKNLAWLSIAPLALLFSPLQANDVTVSGILTVNSGGTADIQCDTLSLGISSATSGAGWQAIYTDGATAAMDFEASRSANLWRWSQNGSGTLKLQMQLDSSNILKLYDTSSSTEKITLNPLGTSTFTNSVTLNGTDNEMTNQTLTGAADASKVVLTKGIADGLYLHPNGSGFVGIGTSSPSAAFNVVGSSTSGDFIVTNNSTSNSISLASLLAPFATGDTYFSVGTSLSASNTALIGLSSVGNTSKYAFLTTYGRPASDFVVTSTGNVGIGIANPSARLEVNGNEQVDGNEQVNGNLGVTNSSTAGSISMASLLAPSVTGDVYFSVGSSLTTDGTALIGLSSVGASTKYAFLTTWGRPASDLVVSSTGNVGIGTANPSTKLEVNGDVTAQGVITAAPGGDIPMFGN